MTRRQTVMPTQWLVLGARSEKCWRGSLRRLPRGSGVFVTGDFFTNASRSKTLTQLRRICRRRALTMRYESAAGGAVRVHDARELRLALAGKCEFVLLSPIFPTRSHPGWRPLSRMRAATLARLATAPVIALGGMNRRRFVLVRKLGFDGWAGIDAWIRT